MTKMMDNFRSDDEYLSEEFFFCNDCKNNMSSIDSKDECDNCTGHIIEMSGIISYVWTLSYLLAKKVFKFFLENSKIELFRK